MNEIDRRRAHLARGGTLANYDRSHYLKNSITMDKEVKNDTSKIDNNQRRDKDYSVLQ